MEPFKNFKHISVSSSQPSPLTGYNEVNGYKIYRSSSQNDVYVIFDNKFNVYRSLGYSGKDVDKDLEGYINYYIDLPDEDKSTVRDFQE